MLKRAKARKNGENIRNSRRYKEKDGAHNALRPKMVYVLQFGIGIEPKPKYL